MKRRGMWADFTEEDIEVMLTIRREEKVRALKSRPKVAARQTGRQAACARAGSRSDDRVEEEKDRQRGTRLQIQGLMAGAERGTLRRGVV